MRTHPENFAALFRTGELTGSGRLTDCTLHGAAEQEYLEWTCRACERLRGYQPPSLDEVLYRLRAYLQIADEHFTAVADEHFTAVAGRLTGYGDVGSMSPGGGGVKDAVIYVHLPDRPRGRQDRVVHMQTLGFAELPWWGKAVLVSP